MSEDTAAPPPHPRFGDTVRLVFVTSLRRWRTCLLIVAIYAVLTGITDAVLRSSTGIVDPATLAPAEVIAAGIAALAALAIFALVNVFVFPVTVGGLSLVGSAEVYGDAIDTQGIARRTFDRSLEAIAAFLLVVLVLCVAPIAVGFLGLALLIAGAPEAGFAVLIFGGITVAVPLLYLLVRLSLAIPVVMREGRGPVEALRRSWELVGGAWWWVFGVAVVVALCIGVLNGVTSLRSFVGEDSVLDFVIGALITSAFTAVSTVLYGVALGVVYAGRAPEDAGGARIAGEVLQPPAPGPGEGSDADELPEETPPAPAP